MSPFDAARYARLLEGLEAAEVCISSLNPEARIDAQFFKKRFLSEDGHLKNQRTVALGKVAFITDGPHGYHEVDPNSSIAMLTAKCAKDWFADRQAADTISSKTHHSSLRSELRVDDLILSTRGTVGACAIIEGAVLPANIDQDVARIELNASCSIKPRYLLAYLNSNFGQDWIERNCTGMVQQGLSLARVRELPVPVFTNSLQDRVSEVIAQASQCRRSAKMLFDQAGSELLHLVGLQAWKTPEPLSYVRRSSEAFASGRLDAQHFQPRFQALTDFIDATGQGAALVDWLSEIQRGRQPDYTEDGLPVVNSKHVLRGEVRLDDDNRNASFGDDDLLIHQSDVLMNGTGVGTIGRCAPYLHEQVAIPDNHVTVLRPKSGLDAVYLSVFLNSMAGQWQVEQRLRGSSGQIELYPNDIGQFRVWVAPANVQAEIRKSVEMSHEQRQRAGQLLDAAKRAVEIAIEDSEAAALAYLDQVAPRAH